MVVTSSKYCVKSSNESCVPFLSNCNTSIQSLQLKVFAGMEDLGHEVPQGSSGYGEDGESLREGARPSLALSLVESKPGRRIQSFMVCAEGHPATPHQQPEGHVEAEGHLLLVLLLLSFSSELPPLKTQLPIFQTFSLKLSAGLPSHVDPFCH